MSQSLKHLKYHVIIVQLAFIELVQHGKGDSLIDTASNIFCSWFLHFYDQSSPFVFLCAQKHTFVIYTAYKLFSNDNGEFSIARRDLRFVSNIRPVSAAFAHSMILSDIICTDFRSARSHVNSFWDESFKSMFSWWLWRLSPFIEPNWLEFLRMEEQACVATLSLVVIPILADLFSFLNEQAASSNDIESTTLFRLFC